MSKRFKNRIKRISANNIELSFMTYRVFFCLNNMLIEQANSFKLKIPRFKNRKENKH